MANLQFCQADWVPNNDAIAECADQWSRWYMQLRPLPPDFHQTLCGLASMNCQMAASGVTPPVASTDNTALYIAGGVVAVGVLAYLLTR